MKPDMAENLLAQNADGEHWIGTLLQPIGRHIPGATLDVIREGTTTLFGQERGHDAIPPTLVDSATSFPAGSNPALWQRHLAGCVPALRVADRGRMGTRAVDSWWPHTDAERPAYLGGGVGAR